MAKIDSTPPPSSNLVLFPTPPTPDGAPEDDACPLKGIAALAAKGEHHRHGHLVEFRTLPAKSILNRSESRRGLNFTWSLNPYRGCEFACRYCYARYTHEFLELRKPEDFEQLIFLKHNAAWLLRRDMHRVGPNEEIAIGTATDPYQPIERRAGITRSLLEVLARYEGLHISIITKSTLIERDIPLLRRIAARSRLTLHVTVTTTSAPLARILEPRAPRPDLRLRTVGRLRQAGLRAGVLCSPVLPSITDTFSSMDLVAQQAALAGASFFHAGPLFLKPCSKPVFLGFLQEHFPALVPSYEQRFATEAFTSSAYQARIRELCRQARARHHLSDRNFSEDQPMPPRKLPEKESATDSPNHGNTDIRRKGFRSPAGNSGASLFE